ncbi:MAG: hypothetical protein ACLGH0_03770 [Thermoanaerobaculia bacterium]
MKESDLSLSANVAMPEVPVEVLDGAPRWSYGNLAANFARVQLLVTWYAGDPDRYLEAIARGLEDESDVPFLVAMKHRLAMEPSLLTDMRRIVAEFATRFGS